MGCCCKVRFLVLVFDWFGVMLSFGDSVYDSDGEFLLIEAADHLPAWVKPTNADNRVNIYILSQSLWS